jgi:putative membrane protein
MEEMIEQCTQMMNTMQGMGGMMGGGMMGGGMMGGMTSGAWWASPWYWLGWVFVLAVLVILVALVWALRYASRSNSRAEKPIDLLKRRYARGEIDGEKFELMKRQLAES